MRIKLNSSKQFFDEILKKDRISLRKFSEKIKENYSNLKQYRRGEKTMLEAVFNKVLEFSSRKDYWQDNLERINENWGAIKGGKTAALNDKNNKRIEYARKFLKNRIRKINIIEDEFFCEFYGALLGDGCISKFKNYEKKEICVICFSGNKSLDSFYLKYLRTKISEKLGLYSYYYDYKNRNVCVLVIRNKSLSLKLANQYNFPVGLKYGKLTISKRLLNLPWSIKKYILRGLFDTDGSIYAKKSEQYRFPIISIASKDRNFLEQLNKLLRSQKYPSYISSHNVCVRGIGNIKRWFGDIGSSNERNLNKYKYFLKYRNLPPKISGS